MNFYVYEIEYPEDGGMWLEADTTDAAKQRYNELSGAAMEPDMLVALTEQEVDQIEQHATTKDTTP